MTQFFNQYHSVRPYLINDTPPPEKERLQSPEAREELDGLYECILCACCSTSCPSFWWNPDKFVGPAGLLHHVLKSHKIRYRLLSLSQHYELREYLPKNLNPIPKRQ